VATGTLAPQFWFQALDDAGVAVAGALVNFYASGTSTRLAAYSDAALTVPLANPAVCDAAGRLVAYLSPVAYKVTVTTSAGVPIGPTLDPVVASAGATGLIGNALGDVFVFGGDPTSPVTAAAYPAGATFDKTHAGTSVMLLDSASLAPGTYALRGNGVAQGAGTLSVGIFNLSDGTPDTPLAEYTTNSTTGAVGTSGAITFAPSGAAKQYAIKTKITAGSGESWGNRLVRTA